MFNSVRIRLTLWYTGAMALILVALASVTYFVIRQNLSRHTDVQAAELADTFLSTVNAEMAETTGTNRLHDGAETAISEHRFRDVIFAVFDAQGKLIGISQPFLDDNHHRQRNPEDITSSLPGLLTGPQPFASLCLAGHPYRAYIRHFSFSSDAGTLIVLQSLHRQEEFSETMATTFWIVIPLTILLAGIGGYLLAGRSLSPVVAMSTQASRIGAENLDTRLTVRNPNDELGHLALSFNNLLDRLSASFDRQKRFVADASHELRTPVAILCGEAEVALGKEGRSEQEYREALNILGDESRRLKHIVEDLFTLARADAGRYPLTYEDFYLDELAAECAKSVRTLADARGISVDCESGSEALIRADETLIRRMLLNLLDNAIKYTPSGGFVSIRCGEQNDSYRLSVQDSGQGIAPDLQPRIFERFFRADKARSRTGQDGGGAGLGLSISSWIASAHGGTLELTSSTTEGSTFTAILPKTPPSN
jgi:heavy metal sensor kinase